MGHSLVLQDQDLAAGRAGLAGVPDHLTRLGDPASAVVGRALLESAVDHPTLLIDVALPSSASPISTSEKRCPTWGTIGLRYMSNQPVSCRATAARMMSGVSLISLSFAVLRAAVMLV